jgi:hypothetical protein
MVFPIDEISSIDGAKYGFTAFLARGIKGGYTA